MFPRKRVIVVPQRQLVVLRLPLKAVTKDRMQESGML